jgi:hypothetical protein
MGYEPPDIKLLGSVEELTLLDKVGSEPDVLTAIIPQLDGSLVPD